jgi:hypothetical protein
MPVRGPGLTAEGIAGWALTVGANVCLQRTFSLPTRRKPQLAQWRETVSRAGCRRKRGAFRNLAASNITNVEHRSVPYYYSAAHRTFCFN